MPLENTLETLAKSLPNWRSLNEAQTSQVIVLRVLQALGYDIWNPFETVAQVLNKRYAPDFIISLNSSERFVLEVKALDKTLSDDCEQPVNYANNNGLRWAVLTNGSEWQFFDNKILARAADKHALTVELKDPRAADYLGRLLSRDVWQKPGSEDALATVVQEVAGEIEVHLKLSEIEVKLRQEMKTGLTPNREGLAKAMRLALDPNERDLAEKNSDDLAQRLLNINSAPPSTPPQPKAIPNPAKPVDACVAITEGMRRTAPSQRKSRSSELTAWLGETELSATNWRDINTGIVEAMIALGHKDFVVSKGYIYKTQQERTKRGGELYPPNAYRALSDGDFLFLHESANSHIQKIRRMLEELEVPPRTLRVVFRKDTYFLP